MHKDISSWAQCFAVYMAAVVKQHSEAIPKMLVYMLAVMKEHKEFKVPA